MELDMLYYSVSHHDHDDDHHHCSFHSDGRLILAMMGKEGNPVDGEMTVTMRICVRLYIQSRVIVNGSAQLGPLRGERLSLLFARKKEGPKKRIHKNGQ
jgi:hypothetical protein